MIWSIIYDRIICMFWWKVSSQMPAKQRWNPAKHQHQHVFSVKNLQLELQSQMATKLNENLQNTKVIMVFDMTYIIGVAPFLHMRCASCSRILITPRMTNVVNSRINPNWKWFIVGFTTLFWFSWYVSIHFLNRRSSILQASRSLSWRFSPVGQTRQISKQVVG